jgi:hypothetical protein
MQDMMKRMFEVTPGLDDEYERGDEQGLQQQWMTSLSEST